MIAGTRHILVPIGNDFEFMRAEYADSQFTNYQAIFDHMNSDPRMNVHARFATLHEYFHDVTSWVQVRFQWKNPDFLLKNPDFLFKNFDFLLKNVDFTIKTGAPG